MCYMFCIHSTRISCPHPTDTGAVAAGTSRCYSKSVQQPAAMLKVDSSCSRHNDSCNNKGDNNNGRKRDRAREKDDGGSTGVLCLDSLSKIEEILVKAGEGEKRLSEKRPDTAPAPEQQQPLPPQELNAKISCNSDGDLRTKFKHDGASQRTGEESHTVPEARAPEADESRAMASFGDRAVPPCFDPLKKNALQLPRRGLFGEEHGEEVPRPRPWAIQKYVRSKGPLAWYVASVGVCVGLWLLKQLLLWRKATDIAVVPVGAPLSRFWLRTGD